MTATASTKQEQDTDVEPTTVDPTTVDQARVDRIVATLESEGACIEPDVISAAEADRANAVIGELLDKEASADTREAGQQRIGEIAVKHQVLRNLLCHPLVVAVWRRLLGEDMVSSTWTVNTIHPGKGKVGWHSDHPFWAMEPPYPAEWLAGQTVWMIDDLTEHNGATGYVSRSHLERRPPTSGEDWPEGGLLATGTRGSVVFGHGAWWHTSTANQSDRQRSVLLGMYVKTIITPMEDMRDQLRRIDNPTELETQIMSSNQRIPQNIVTPHPDSTG